MSAGRMAAGVAVVGVLAGVVAFSLMPSTPIDDVPSLPASARPDPAAGRPRAPVGRPDAATPATRASAREAILRMRAEGSAPRVALPQGVAAAPGSPAANGIEMIHRRSERSLRRFDLTLKDVGDLLKDAPEVGEAVDDVRAQLEADLDDIQAQLGAGEMTLQEAHEAVFAAEELAREGLTDAPGDVGKMLSKALPPPPPSPEDGDAGWGGQPLEEAWGQ